MTKGRDEVKELDECHVRKNEDKFSRFIMIDIAYVKRVGSSAHDIAGTGCNGGAKPNQINEL